MSLLGDIWDSIVAKVRSLISSALADFKYWVNARISDAIAGIRQVYTNVTNYLTNVYNNINNFITNVNNTINNIIQNTYNNFSNFITNVNHITNQFITNVIGVSSDLLNKAITDLRSFIDYRLQNYAPQGFQSNPELFIQTHADERYHFLMHQAAESFFRGFEAGLKEKEA